MTTVTTTRLKTGGQGWRRLIPVAVLIAFIALWQFVTVAFSVPSYAVPTPVDVLRTMFSSYDTLLTNLWPTAFESLAGFALGNIVAFALAVAFVHSRALNDALMPLAIFVQTIPIIAIAPILVILLGPGYSSKIAIAALISFFPTLINAVRGLKAVTPQQLELMRMMSAYKRETFFKVRLYACLPYLFSALKITATTSVIGAIIAEWVGSQQGLGNLIIQSTFNYQTPLLYATIIVASMYAMLLFLLVGAVERLLVRWKVEP